MLTLREKLFDLRHTVLNPERTPFILLSFPRSGSTLLTNYLENHPGIKMYKELLNLSAIKPVEAREALDSTRLYLKRRLYNHRYPSSVKAIGFKLFCNHCRRAPIKAPLHGGKPHPKLIERRKRFRKMLLQNYEKREVIFRYRQAWKWLAKSKNIKIVHLKRDNLLRLLVSLARADQHNYWTAVNPDELRDIPPITLSLESVSKTFRYITLYHKAVESLFKDHEKIEIFYEDLIADKEEKLKQILNFLGLPFHPPTSEYLQLGKQPLFSAIKNYSELKAHFSSTPWSRFFEE